MIIWPSPFNTAPLIGAYGKRTLPHADRRQGGDALFTLSHDRILQSSPGVGADRAKKLLEHFGTVRACFTASPTQLSEVEGIGSKTAAAIDQVVN